MSIELQHYSDSGLNYYAKPEPVAAADWVDDVVTLTDPDSIGRYAATVADPAASYAVFRRVGATAASTDPAEATITATVTTDSASREASKADVSALAMEASLQAIKAKTDLITTDSVTVKLISPVGPDGATLNLVRADDYQSSLVNRPWRFHVSASDVAFTSNDVVSVKLHVRDKQTGEQLFEAAGAATDTTEGGEDVIRLEGEIAGEQSLTLRRGNNTALFDLVVMLTGGVRFSPITDGEVNVSGGGA